MEAKMVSSSMQSFVPHLIGLLVLGWAVAVLVGKLEVGRGMLIALMVVGMAMCSFGVGRAGTTLGWTHPVTIAGCLIGIAALVMVGMSLLGVKLPLIGSERAAFLALIGMMGAKWLLAFFI